MSAAVGAGVALAVSASNPPSTPAAALWQGVCMILLVPLFWYVNRQDVDGRGNRNARRALILYVLVCVLLMPVSCALVGSRP